MQLGKSFLNFKKKMCLFLNNITCFGSYNLSSETSGCHKQNCVDYHKKNGNLCCNNKNDASKLVKFARNSLVSLRSFFTCEISHQPTPFKLHPVFLLIFYMLYAFLTACCYFGWGSLSLLLFKSGAYAWKCDPNVENNWEIGTANKPYLCDDQDAAVQPLFTVCMACHSIMTAFAGILLDEYGPKITALLGQTLNTIAWLLLAFSGRCFVAYYPAFVLMGLGADTGFIPTLSVARLFPRNFSLVITMMGASSTASFAVPLILEKVWNGYSNLSFRHVCFLYIIFGTAFCGVIAAFLMPRKCFRKVNIIDVGGHRFEEEDDGLKDNESQEEVLVETSSQRETAASEKSQIEDASDFVLKESNVAAVDSLDLLSRSKWSEGIDEEYYELSTPSGICAFDGKDENCIECVNKSEEFIGNRNEKENNNVEIVGVAKDRRKKDGKNRLTGLESEATTDLDEETTRRDDDLTKCEEIRNVCIEMNSRSVEKKREKKNLASGDFCSVWSDFCSRQFIIIAIISAALQISTSYYQSSYSRAFSVSVAQSMELMLPFSFIPCIILGRMIDKYGILPIMSVVNTAGVLSYILSLSSCECLHYISALTFCIYISVDSDIVFCYVGCVFAPRHFGKLCGVAIAFGGVSSFLTYPLYDHLTIKYLNGNTAPVKIVILTVLIFVYFLHAYLWYLKRKRKVNFILNSQPT